MKRRTRNKIKSATIGALVVVPVIITTAFFAQPAFAAESGSSNFPLIGKSKSLSDIKAVMIKGLDTSIARLQKVRNRASDSSNQNKDTIISKIDETINYLKDPNLRAKINNSNSLDELQNIKNDIHTYVEQHNVDIGNFFDEKDMGKEKAFSKIEKNLTKAEEKINILSADQQTNAKSVLQKAKNLLTQLKNEDKKDMSKADIKRDRRELSNTLNDLRKLIK